LLVRGGYAAALGAITALIFAAAVLASSVAELARARAVEAEVRRREAVLAAEMATLLLSGGRVADASTRPPIGRRRRSGCDRPGVGYRFEA
jgi:hypothetical protein